MSQIFYGENSESVIRFPLPETGNGRPGAELPRADVEQRVEPRPIRDPSRLAKGKLNFGSGTPSADIATPELRPESQWDNNAISAGTNSTSESISGIGKQGTGLVWEKKFCQGDDPYAGINWEKRTAKITKGDGAVVFEQRDIEMPSFWSQTATDIVASKYFRGRMDSPTREKSARQMVDRIANTVAGWGWEDGYFASEQDHLNFKNDLKWLLINQYGSFNSPVWFNVGIYEQPRTSACFILAVEDNMQSILDWYRDEGWIFKFGSGAGANLSKLRSSKEPLSRGGHSSGPVSFMKGADGIANSIRSGGETRRAAKMVVLNVDHPDIKTFIYCKKEIEAMAKILQAAGIKSSVEAGIFDPYTLLPYQNANNSVRVSDDFMRAVVNDEIWELKAVTSGAVIERLPAREIMEWMADAAWHSADPGMQMDTTINYWHTLADTSRINASNPCSEYMSLDNSACNLASINLLKFLRGDYFDTDGYKKAIDTFIMAQDILVDRSSYPTEKITENAHNYRQLGLGYANLGATLMTLGLPYDSDAGRAWAGVLTAILTGEGYRMSAELAKAGGPFRGFSDNRHSTLDVLQKHTQRAQELVGEIKTRGLVKDGYLVSQAQQVWEEALVLAEQFGVRNSQATVLAPTGTISFMMDCATTGIEPGLALVSYKKLVGGGTLKLVNNQVESALKYLGYNEEQINKVSEYILEHETIEGAPGLKEEHLPVFDCSFKATNGQRSISYQGHLRMMAAAQPFISGAISKTVNLPASATKEDMKDAFISAWQLGLKAVAFYRDGSKTVQPLNVSDKAQSLVEHYNGHSRFKLPDERQSMTHKFTVGGHKGYLTVGFYPDSQKVGETFISIAKEGSTVSGLLDVVATLTSIALQSGVPLKTLVRKFKDMRFDPAGFTPNPDIPTAKSIVDYVFRYMGMRFLSTEDREEIFGPAESPAGDRGAGPVEDTNSVLTALTSGVETAGQICGSCGSLMFKAGSCFTCPNCFNTTGVCN